jgi:hypothetical protein
MKRRGKAIKQGRQELKAMEPSASRERENAGMAGFAKLGPLDQLDWLIILLAVLLGMLAKRHHLLGLPAWFLDWAFPFLLIVTGYALRRKITSLRNRGRGRSTTEE